MKKAKATLLGLATCGALMVLSTTPVGAQNAANQHMDTGTKKMMKSSDSAFAMKAAQGGMAEVKLGQLAADKATSPDVKAFGQQMVDDHTKANNDLKAAAEAESMKLPGDVNAKQQAMYDKLSKMSGPAFDKMYVNDMVKDHEEDVKDFQREASAGKDAKVKDFASTTLPVLQGHLTKIKGIQSSMGTATKGM